MEFFTLGFFHNKWLWTHVLLGGLLAKLVHTKFKKGQTMAIVIFVAVAWELYEYFASDIPAIYGTSIRFYYDAAGDIIGAILMALIVLF